MALFQNRTTQTTEAQAGQNNVMPGNFGGRGQRNQRFDANGNPLPKAEVYINIVFMSEIEREDGTVEPISISLPFGIPLDTMSDAEIAGNSVESAELAGAKNWFRDQFLAEAQKVAPGQAIRLGEDFDLGLDVGIEIRRGGKKAAVKAGANRLIAGARKHVG